MTEIWVTATRAVGYRDPTFERFLSILTSPSLSEFRRKSQAPNFTTYPPLHPYNAANRKILRPERTTLQSSDSPGGGSAR